MVELRRPVLLYDADCRFCRWTARAVDRLDRGRELALLPLGDGDATSLLAPIPQEKRHESWRLALVDGSVVGYGRGLVELTRAVRVTRPLGWALSRVPGGLLDLVYEVLAGRKERLARFVPDGPAPRRFP